jgi:hypothetical protein
MTEFEVNVPSQGVALAGTLLLLDSSGKFPCVVMAGGTLSQTRDGAFSDPQGRLVERDALRQLAKKLAAAGYASLRWDKRGHGKTPAGARPAQIEDDVADLMAAIQFARQHGRLSRVIVAGESAGAHFACLAAKQGVSADGYIFLGALCSPYENLYAYNYGRLQEFAERSEENRCWAEQTAMDALAIGVCYKEMFAAARRGDETYTVRYGDYQRVINLDRLRAQIEEAIDEQFRYIRAPALVLHGMFDLNVPSEDAANAERIMKANGNPAVTRVVIEGVDHNFQIAAPDADMRFRERHSFNSIKRPYSEELYATMTDWLKQTFPETGSRPDIIAWNGIQIIEDVTDATKQPGVETLEGRIGPLMKGDKSQAHYIDMPPGLFLAEHLHSTESLIYTVRGNWVLCSGGRRHLMKPGSLFWFKANEPTGWEVPFDEPSFVLIFKGYRDEMSDEDFLKYLRGLAERLERERANGTPFHFRDLPPDHPARIFAREVNPLWEAQLHPATETLKEDLCV